MNTLQRRIQFFQAINLSTGRPLSGAEIRDLSAALKDASASGPAGYLEERNGDAYRPWIDSATSFPVKLRFGKTRKMGLPRIEGGGEFRNIEVDQKRGEGINDLFHALIFSNSIVGYEANSHAPQLSALARYAQRKANWQIAFVALLNRSAARRLSSMSTISMLDVKVKSEKLDELEIGASPLKDAISRLQEFSTGREIEIVLKAGRRRSDALSPKLATFVRKWFKSGTLPMGVEKALIKGKDEDTGRVSAVNLLREIIVHKVDLLTMDDVSRTVVTDRAYQAIKGAYDAVKDEVLEAIGE